jgi:sec-independent protein translocase protein TatA
MLGNIGTKEIIIIAVVFIILFGAKKIPELSKSLVESIRHIRGAFKDAPEDDSDSKEAGKKR